MCKPAGKEGTLSKMLGGKKNIGPVGVLLEFSYEASFAMYVNFRRLLPINPQRGTKCHVGQRRQCGIQTGLTTRVASRVQGALQISHPTSCFLQSHTYLPLLLALPLLSCVMLGLICFICRIEIMIYLTR